MRSRLFASTFHGAAALLLLCFYCSLELWPALASPPVSGDWQINSNTEVVDLEEILPEAIVVTDGVTFTVHNSIFSFPSAANKAAIHCQGPNAKIVLNGTTLKDMPQAGVTGCVQIEITDSIIESGVSPTCAEAQCYEAVGLDGQSVEGFVENSVVRNFYKNIFMAGVSNLRITNSLFEHSKDSPGEDGELQFVEPNTAQGVTWEGGFLLLENNLIQDLTYDALELYSVANVTFKNNIVKNVGSGFHFDRGHDNSGDVRLIHALSNTFEDSSIRMEYTHDSIIDSNTFIGTNSVVQCKHCSGIVIRNNKFDVSLCYAIHISDSKDVTLENNEGTDSFVSSFKALAVNPGCVFTSGSPQSIGAIIVAFMVLFSLLGSFAFCVRCCIKRLKRKNKDKEEIGLMKP
uniref:Right handed beta helix domain-containing protein n=1 Tax=Aplanochytrium stocchinoi TaxID=215587 RepID=A0A7S3PNR5_9STRA|mmetsp:Transcript_11516/g.15012  ORF Transcript_11516/g.15012 Transcript_11516/m.15012 type:complete len:403 (-) Transcript_11516:244-1452(-)|eukprot:CAMPEP_0204828278 /NCGR_PEP_ID=MMETSP1346-20131115/5950_1 /ASSEMBLY_ACC=CAM_ASM_000771 /TAXON_ID=215587 /ORGANISM="Aplanochytrium stocchinoi, Strain GSBS06" /LENGTH=402 /DNA_ID=CAMNT_0051957199 /DNA_START=229 /DNA_END=1437 /DNA_ORIENTATION=-